jgi:alkyl hydroperoxide reductase subunit AhpC
MQLTAKHGVATPVNWKQGEDVVIPAALSNEDAVKKYPAGFNTVLPCLRLVPQPQ